VKPTEKTANEIATMKGLNLNVCLLIEFGFKTTKSSKLVFQFKSRFLSLKKCNQSNIALTKKANELINGEHERNTIQANC
jgi:hypothetical protein